ncbi:hypothetical protein Tco_0846676 [Tanacetum coccineum]
MRPFGCPLTILNTLDPLGKFDGKSDEGYLLGYSTTRSGPDWMFDLDFLTNTMNYIPVSVENQITMDAGTQESYVAGSSGKDKEPTQEYILLPLHPHRPRIPVEDVIQDAQEKSLNNCSLMTRRFPQYEITPLDVSAFTHSEFHKDHPKGQILGDPKSAVQTRGKIQKASSVQQALFADILKKFDYNVHQNIFTTPIKSNKPLVKDEDGVDVDVHIYRSMIGSLMYLTGSRPDIMFTVCACARFQVTLKASHLNAVKQIFRLSTIEMRSRIIHPRMISATQYYHIFEPDECEHSTSDVDRGHPPQKFSTDHVNDKSHIECRIYGMKPGHHMTSNTTFTRKKQVTFSDKPGTSSSNTQKHEVHQKVQQTNVPVIPSTGVNDSTEASGSKPRSNTKKNRILPAKKENKKEVEVHLRTNKSVWTKVNRVDSSISSKRVVINSNSESVCKTCNKCLNSASHEMCVVNILNSVNATPTVKIVLNKGKQIWKPKGKLSDNRLNKTKQVWKATGKLFANVGYQWRSTGKKVALGKLNCGYQWRPTGKFLP